MLVLTTPIISAFWCPNSLFVYTFELHVQQIVQLFQDGVTHIVLGLSEWTTNDKLYMIFFTKIPLVMTLLCKCHIHVAPLLVENWELQSTWISNIVPTCTFCLLFIKNSFEISLKIEQLRIRFSLRWALSKKIQNWVFLLIFVLNQEIN